MECQLCGLTGSPAWSLERSSKFWSSVQAECSLLPVPYLLSEGHSVLCQKPDSTICTLFENMGNSKSMEPS